VRIVYDRIQSRKALVPLIAMPTRKRRGMGWGTTSYKVGILCRCPILLLK
jgi:hypothetical protein